MMTLRYLLLWAHILMMAGAFGVMLAAQVGLSPAARNDRGNGVDLVRLGSAMLAFGLLAGLALLWQMVRAAALAGAPVSGHFLGIVGTKFALWVVAGACMGISAKRQRAGKGGAGALRWVSIVVLALAALMGVML